MKFLEAPPRFVFFTGKGGVGKTSVACATALHLAHRGKRVLLVSTDPASNVGQVLGVTIGNTVTSIEQVPGLSALEIDPQPYTVLRCKPSAAATSSGCAAAPSGSAATCLPSAWLSGAPGRYRSRGPMPTSS